MDRETVNQSGASSLSDANPCPICLAPPLQESYLDTCLHKFCYKCIVQWVKVVSGKRSSPPSSAKCPLCKTENFSIISGYDGSFFERHYVNKIFDNSFTFNFSKAQRFRLQCYYTEPGILNDIFNVSRFWKLRKYIQPNIWLFSWLRREIQALMQEEDVDVIVHHIVGVIDSFFKRIDQLSPMKNFETIQEEFKTSVSDAAKPFLLARTDRFASELELFLASGLTIEAYDAVYKQRLGWNTPRETTEPVETEPNEQRPVVPYLYIFDADSDNE